MSRKYVKHGMTKSRIYAVNEERTAIFSGCRKYRYVLRIVWDAALPDMQVIGLNPSTADEIQDDPTVRRCKAFARREGCGGLAMTNLFAFRATDPKVLKKHPQPIGEFSFCAFEVTRGKTTHCFASRNDAHLFVTAYRSKVVVAAWGNHGTHLNRYADVAKLILSAGATLRCFRLTSKGQPEHPLYMPADQPLIPYER